MTPTEAGRARQITNPVYLIFNLTFLHDHTPAAKPVQGLSGAESVLHALCRVFSVYHREIPFAPEVLA